MLDFAITTFGTASLFLGLNLKPLRNTLLQVVSSEKFADSKTEEEMYGQMIQSAI